MLAGLSILISDSSIKSSIDRSQSFSLRAKRDAVAIIIYDDAQVGGERDYHPRRG